MHSVARIGCGRNFLYPIMLNVVIVLVIMLGQEEAYFSG